MGSYNIPYISLRCVVHYITPHRPLASCTHIYNSMNYESVSFHHSWNALPDVQITLRKTTTAQAELAHRIPTSKPVCMDHRRTIKCKKKTNNFKVTWFIVYNSISFTPWTHFLNPPICTQYTADRESKTTQSGFNILWFALSLTISWS